MSFRMALYVAATEITEQTERAEANAGLNVATEQRKTIGLVTCISKAPSRPARKGLKCEGLGVTELWASKQPESRGRAMPGVPRPEAGRVQLPSGAVRARRAHS